MLTRSALLAQSCAGRAAANGDMEMTEPAIYRWVSRRWLPERRGEVCRLLIFHRRRVLVEFEDGYRVISVLGCIKRLDQKENGKCLTD